MKINDKQSKIGRNDPCPCGSGLKHKKCHGRTLNTSSPKTDYKRLGSTEYDSLLKYEQSRFRELSEVYSDVLKLIQDYERLVCRMTTMLGHSPPKKRLDRCLRDLMCDAFDVLYKVKEIILHNYYPLGFPLLRRAYETICLIHYFELAPEKVEKWENGHQFDNKEIRKFLDSHPMGETEGGLRATYKQFCSGTHVNRDFIPSRFLGEGNEFTLGAIAPTDHSVTSEYLEETVKLWYWFVALIAFHYKELFSSLDPGFGKDYLEVANQAEPAIKELFEHKLKMREQRYAEGKAPRALPS